MEIVPHGGVAEIGGNCFEVSSGRSRVLLDFGISFKRYGQAFSEFLKPRKVNGMADWLLAGVAPDVPGLYRQDYRGQSGARAEERRFDAVFISHPHIDHLGLVPLLRPDITVASSPTAFAVARAIEETGGSFDQSDFTTFREQFRLRPDKRKGQDNRLVRVKYSSSGDSEKGETPQHRPWHTESRLELDGITAHLMPVDHSIHGARGILLEGDVQIAYSGDLRMHGRNKQWTERFVERCAGVDALIIEGTNVQNPKEVADEKKRHDGHLHDFKALGDYTEGGVESYIAEQLAGEHGYVFVAYPQRDLDRLETFLRVARKIGRKLCLSLKQAYLLDMVDATASKALDTPIPRTDDPDVRIYIPRKSWGLVGNDALRGTQPDLVAQDYQTWERPYLSHPNAVTRADVKADPGRFLVFADIWNLTELHEYAAGPGMLDPPGGAYVNSKTEPFSEEMVHDRARLQWWLNRWGLREVGAHVSGHATEKELLWMADAMGAKRIIPVHTEGVEHYSAVLGRRAVEPRLGAAIKF